MVPETIVLSILYKKGVFYQFGDFLTGILKELSYNVDMHRVLVKVLSIM